MRREWVVAGEEGRRDEERVGGDEANIILRLGRTVSLVMELRGRLTRIYNYYWSSNKPITKTLELLESYSHIWLTVGFDRASTPSSNADKFDFTPVVSKVLIHWNGSAERWRKKINTTWKITILTSQFVNFKRCVDVDYLLIIRIIVHSTVSNIRVNTLSLPASMEVMLTPTSSTFKSSCLF